MFHGFFLNFVKSRESTDDELTEKELKQIEADDQAIQTILLGLPEDIYAAVDSCETAQEIWLRVQQMMKGSCLTNGKAPRQDQPSYNQNYMQQPMPIPEDITDHTTAMNMALALMAKAFKLNYSTPTNNNQRISSNPRNRQIAQPGNLNGYNVVQNVRNQVAQNPRVQNVGNQNGLIDVPGNANLNGNGNLELHGQAKEKGCCLSSNTVIDCSEGRDRNPTQEFDLMAAAADLDEIEEVNANCILMANLQQASTSIEVINFIWKFMGTVRFGNDHVAAILGFGDLQWGNILITMVYFVEGLDGVDLLKGDRSTNLYTINLHEMAFASSICLMARASSTKSWLWHQRLSHLNFDTINDLARNDLVSGLPKFKYNKEHLCPSREQGKRQKSISSTKTSSKFKAEVTSSSYGFVWSNENCQYKRKAVCLGDCGRLLSLHVEAARTMLIFSRAPLFLWAEAIATACFTQNRSIIHRRFNKTPYELINGRKPDISFLHVFGALCYPKNDREDIGKLGAKGDIGFFIGYSADSCAYRIYNRRTKKIMETMNVSFDELLAMAFEQRSLKPELQSMTSRQISSGLDLTYAPSTITTQQPSEGELDLLFEAMYDNYIGGQPSATARTVLTAQEPQVRQTSMTSTSIADSAPIPTNSSSLVTNVPNTSQDVDELNLQQQHAQQQGIQAHLQSKNVADNVSNAMSDVNTFVNPFANPSTSAAESSSSHNVNPSNMHTFYQPYPYEFQWTKDHPLEQVIGEPSRPILTRNQLRSDGDICMYALTVSTMESKNVKEAMTNPAWIDSMQEELLQFKRLDVWVLVPAPDNISSLTLKWLFKNKHDEEQTVRNACFVRNLEGVDLLKVDRLTNLYTINLHEMASVSPICLMA
nr:hypothetical protein [Tanacetum cinerariifolium]